MSNKRRITPDEIESKVLYNCRRRCSICYGLDQDTEIKQGQIAHIDKDPSNYDIDNLVFLCFDHHNQYDSKTSQSKNFTKKEVISYRKLLVEHIAIAWNKPVSFGEIKYNPLDKFSGKYIREGSNDNAELSISLTEQNQLQVDGFAVWGTKNELGPSTGSICFSSPIINNKIIYKEEYKFGIYALEMDFLDNNIISIKETPVPGSFGLNVTFEGDFKKV